MKNSTKNSINNSINNSTKNQVHMKCKYQGRELYVEISDDGVGIQDVEKAMEPLYTSKPQLDRSGMGFSFMEAFMDELAVTSEPGHGTTVKMKKVL
ncbi:ATP-binding protein [Agathobacter rectalis]|uniref:ATP-binding protein n=1 Tax=Agathobacter rectalis TaxID=39491 RepID=UPI003FD7EBB0